MGILYVVIRLYYLWNVIKVNDFVWSFFLYGCKICVFGWVLIFGGNYMFKEWK